MKVLIAGDTPRWLQNTRSTLPTQAKVRTCTDYIGAVDILFSDDEIFDLCIIANNMPNKNDGLKILRELRQEGRRDAVIIYSSLISRRGIEEANMLKATVVDWDTSDTSDLQAVVDQLLTIA